MSWTTRKSSFLNVFFGVVKVWLAEEGVLAGDVHRLDAARVDGRHHVGDYQAGVRGQRPAAPGVAELGERGFAQDLVSRESVGQAASVAASLDVVLAPERRYAGAGTTELACQEGEIQEAVGVCGAHGVLSDPHSPYEAGAAEGRASVGPGGLFDLICRDAGYLLGVVKVVFLDRLPPLVVVFGAVADELGVGQILVNYDLGHGVEQRDISSGSGP